MKNRYSLEVGFKGDVFFASQPTSRKNNPAGKAFHIAHVFYSEDKANKWIDEMNDAAQYKPYKEH